jgi:hypothetical protein
VSGNVVMCGVKFIWCVGMDDEMNLVCDVKCLILNKGYRRVFMGRNVRCV